MTVARLFVLAIVGPPQTATVARAGAHMEVKDLPLCFDEPHILVWAVDTGRLDCGMIRPADARIVVSNFGLTGDNNVAV